jgi:hypothetical protein
MLAGMDTDPGRATQTMTSYLIGLPELLAATAPLIIGVMAAVIWRRRRPS